MDWGALVSKWMDVSGWIVQSIAWPCAAILIALAFRTEVRGLFARIRRGSWAGAELEFEREVQEVADKRQQAAVAERAAEQPNPGDAAAQDRVEEAGRDVNYLEPMSDQSYLDWMSQHNYGLRPESLALATGNTRQAIDLAWLALRDAILSARLPKSGFAYAGKRPGYLPMWTDADVKDYAQLELLRTRMHNDEAMHPSIEAATNFIKVAADLRRRVKQWNEEIEQRG